MPTFVVVIFVCLFIHVKGKMYQLSTTSHVSGQYYLAQKVCWLYVGKEKNDTQSWCRANQRTNIVYMICGDNIYTQIALHICDLPANICTYVCLYTWYYVFAGKEKAVGYIRLTGSFKVPSSGERLLLRGYPCFASLAHESDVLSTLIIVILFF